MEATLQVEVTSPESCTRVIAIEAPFEDFKNKIEKAYVKYQKRINIPGFRKGKAPLSIVKSRYKDSIENEVLPEIISDFFQQACEDKNITGINQPQIDDFKYEEGSSISFSAKVEIRPEVSLKEYKGIKVKRNKVKVNKTEIKNYIKYLQEGQAKSTTLKRATKKNDFILAEFQELSPKGIPSAQSKAEKREYKIGSGLFGEDFDIQLESMKNGEEKQIAVTIPKDHSNPKIAGQNINFKVTIHDVIKKTLPKLDDEFAKDQGHDTFVAFEDDLKKRMQESGDAQENDRLRHEIMENIVTKNDFDVPNSMVDNYLNYMFKEQQQKDAGLDEQTFKESSRPYALQQIKEHMLIDEIRKVEKIEVNDEDINAYIETASRGNEDAKKNLLTYLENPQAKQRLTDDLSVGKVHEFLEANATIK